MVSLRRYLLILLLSSVSFVVHATTHLTLMLDWFLNPNHASIFVAEHEGFFKSAGLDVKIQIPSDPSDPLKLVAANQVDVGISYEPQYDEARKRRMPIAWVGTLMPTPLDCLIALPKSGIRTLEDLKGKRIGDSVSVADDRLLRALLNKANLSENDIKRYNVHYGLVQALLSGRVDAITGVNRNYELIQLRLMGEKPIVFYPEDHGVENYAELIFIANDEHKDQQKVTLFLTALKKATTYLKAHPDAMWRAFAKVHPDMDNALNRQSWMEVVRKTSVIARST